VGETVALAYAPDGRTLAVISREEMRTVVQLLDAAGDRKPRRLADGLLDPTCLAFSPDGKTLAVAGRQGGLDDHRVWLIDVATGEVRRRLAGHFNAIRSVVFSPDGRLLASAGGENFSGRPSDYSIRIWRVARAPCIRL
jgi:WD40 repeat protein